LSRRTATLLAVLTAGVLTRIAALQAFDRILPASWLYVDEHVYAAGLPEGPFERPPGTALVAAPLVGLGVPAARAVFSALSLLPAVLIARRATCAWSSMTGVLAAVDPFLVLAGMQILPEAPAAALVAVSASLLAGRRGAPAGRAGIASSGLVLGAACLFRAELGLLVPAALLFRPGRKWLLFSAAFALPLAGAMLSNADRGGGLSIASNASENLWLGTRIELLRTPPGVEFETLVGVDPYRDGDFLEKAAGNTLSDPLGTASLTLRKAMAGMALPGEGRNLDDPWLLLRTGLAFLLPVPALALLIGLARSIRSSGDRDDWLRRAAAPALAVSSAVFFPALWYRTAFMPLFWNSAAVPPSGGERRALALSAVLLAACSLVRLDAARPGLSYIARAGEEIDHGMPLSALASLDSAGQRGFSGPDMNNLGGIALAMLGRGEEASREFGLAQAGAPGSPTVWKNTSVLLWGLGRREEAREAAVRAVRLDPRLADLLAPITGARGSIGR
jgi:hypothetical protein